MIRQRTGQHKTADWNVNSSQYPPVVAREQASVKRVDSQVTHETEQAESAQIKSLFDHQQFDAVRSLDGKQESAPIEQALSLFDQLSSQLTTSYRGLEQKVSQLKNDLSEEELHRREQLKEKEQLATRLSTLLEILPAGVVVLDGKGAVSECNPAAIDLLGEPLKGELWVDVIKKCFSPKHDDGHEVSLKDGRRVRIETRSMTSGSGQLILLSDLTETRLLQAQVSRAERLSSLGRMVASLAHQIRTPLSTAMLYAGHLCQPAIETPMRLDCADKLMSRLTHLEHQIRDMLIFAKGETRLAEQLTVVDFLESLRAAAEPVLHKANVTSHWKNDTQKVGITCNKEALVGACLNLINNSIEAADLSKENREPLVLTIQAETDNEGRLCLVIADNGPGIPKNQQDKVFEPFYTTKPQGTGLGLAVVQAVVKAHHGEFTVKSSKDGLTAMMALPVYELKKMTRRSRSIKQST